MRRLGSLVAIFLLLLPSVAHASSWLSTGHDAQMTRFNPSERVLGPNTVRRIHRVWTAPSLLHAIATDRYIFGITAGPTYSVLVLDARSGATVHRYTPSTLKLDTTRFDYPQALAYADGRLVVAAERTVLAVNPLNGNVLWRVPGGADAVIVDGRTVYTGKGCQNPCGILASYAIDLLTGQVRWRHSGNFGQAPALVAGRVYQPWGEMQSVTHVYDPASGATVANLSFSAVWTGDTRHAYANIFRAGPGVTPHASLSEIGPAGKPLWTADLGKAFASFPVLAYGTLYVASNRFHPGVVAIDAATGRTRWGADVGKPVLLAGANHLIFVANQERGPLTVLDAGSGRVLRSLSVAGVTTAGIRDLMIAGGTLYLLSDSGLTALRP